MSKEYTELSAAAAIITLLIVLFYVAHQRDELKVEAVKHGFAEWVANERGNVSFHWKENLIKK